MTTAVDGVVSGIDTTGLINAVIEAESANLRAMQAQRAEVIQRRDRIATLTSRIKEISTAVDSINETSDFESATITSPDALAFEATASASAKTGSYTIEVASLARQTVLASNGSGITIPSKAIGSSGSYNVTVGSGSPISVAYASTDSFESLATKLDAVDGVSAYLIQTSDSPAKYEIVVQGESEGTANAVTVTRVSGTAPTFIETQAAQNASLQVNGLTVTSSTNTVSGIIPGVDLDLSVEGGPAEVLTVGQDNEAIYDKVQAIVDAVNDARSYYNAQAFFDVDSGSRGPLSGETTTRRAMDRLGFIFANSYTVTGSTTRGLAELGFKTARDGTLEFDRSKLDEAYKANPSNIVTFLTSDDGPLKALKTEVDDVLVDSVNGSLTTKQESLNDSIEGYDKRISDFQAYLDSYSSRLRAQFNDLEVTMGRLQSASSQLLSMVGTQ